MTGPKRAAASHPDVSIAWALGFHGLFGSLHELVHLLAAWQTGRLVGVDDRAGALRVAARAAFGRSVLVSELPAGHVVDVARHAGWVASAVIAAITILIVRQ